jgi:hypothetical protein
MNATSNVPLDTKMENLKQEIEAKKFSRTAILSRETKGTYFFQEDVQNDMAVFRNLYVEKWTQIRGANKIRVTIEVIQ